MTDAQKANMSAGRRRAKELREAEIAATGHKSNDLSNKYCMSLKPLFGNVVQFTGYNFQIREAKMKAVKWACEKASGMFCISSQPEAISFQLETDLEKFRFSSIYS